MEDAFQEGKCISGGKRHSRREKAFKEGNGIKEERGNQGEKRHSRRENALKEGRCIQGGKRY